MPNSYTICRHEKREEIEDRLAVGNSLRDIAGQFQVSKSSVDRHQTCIAAELKAFKASRVEKLNETLIERLNRYRGVAEQYPKDDEKALAALDRCYKQIDIEAKLTGAYQKKQENEKVTFRKPKTEAVSTVIDFCQEARLQHLRQREEREERKKNRSWAAQFFEPEEEEGELGAPDWW